MHIENFELLREFKITFKKALAPLSEAQDGCFNEKKNRGSKISVDTVPLKGVLFHKICQHNCPVIFYNNFLSKAW
jgi:hypothetical protein